MAVVQRAAALVLASMAWAGAASAQAPQVIDRVVAVVGTRAVLQSQVDEQLFIALSGPNPPRLRTRDDTAKVRRQLVSDIIDEELMVQEAQRDTTIKVTDEEVTESVEERVRNARQRFSSDDDYRNELRRTGFLSPDEYRRWLNDNQRNELLKNRLLEKLRGKGQMKPVIPTEKEMRDFFEEQKGGLGKRPGTIAFKQIVISPKPDSASRVRAYLLADSIAAELRKGADFTVAAKRFSQDPGSKELGGSLGWTRRGQWVPAFENVAFYLKPGTISQPVETPFGFHVIQVERVQPGEVLARHILISPEISPAATDSARVLAERVLAAAGKGANFDSLQRIHHDATEEREANDVPADRLPPQYARALARADTGQVVPLTLDAAGRRKFAVVKLTERRPEGEMRFEDMKDRIRDRLADQLGIRRYLDRLRKRTFVEVRE